MSILRARHAETGNGDAEARAPSKDELFRRTELLAAAEKRAAIAAEQAQLAGEATREDLLSLPVVAAAMESEFSSEADSCDRWAAEADRSGDVLLARALRRLQGSLREAAENAASLRIEAEGYAESLEDDDAEEPPAVVPPEATIGPTVTRT